MTQNNFFYDFAFSQTALLFLLYGERIVFHKRQVLDRIQISVDNK